MKLLRISTLVLICLLTAINGLAQTRTNHAGGDTAGAQVALSAIVEPALSIEFTDNNENLSQAAENNSAPSTDGSNHAHTAEVSVPAKRIESGNVFEIDFGTVNGLGVGQTREGVSVAVQSDGALYTKPITLRVRYAGLSETTANVSVKLDRNDTNQAGQTAIREGTTALTSQIVSETPVTVTTFSVSDASVTRQVGLFISNTNGPEAVKGPVKARLIYQVMLP